MGKNKATPEIVEEMRRLYFDEKLSLKQVAEKVGYSDHGVMYQLKKRFGNVRSRSESLKGRAVTEKMRETARKLGKSRVGPKNPTWKGKVNRCGYWAIRKPDHPYASNDGYVMEHRLIMEKLLGRYLQPDEDVHHINENKKDNRPENLMVIKKSEHGRYHGLKRIADRTHNNFIYVTPEQIKKEITKGGTMKEIASRLNMEVTTLYKKIERAGLKQWYGEWRKNA